MPILLRENDEQLLPTALWDHGPNRHFVSCNILDMMLVKLETFTGKFICQLGPRSQLSDFKSLYQ